MSFLNWNEAKTELISLKDWVRYGASCFQTANLFYGHGTDNPWDEALALALFAINLNYNYGEKLSDCRLTMSEKAKIHELFEERIYKRVPVPYLTHMAHYGGFEFYVDKRVLIPRSPIVELIENQFQPWIDSNEVFRILDMGTGSACLPILCAYYFPEAIIDAVDNDINALDVAKINIEKYQLEEQVHLIESDLFSQLEGQCYDIIITNPPYVDAEDMANLPAEFLHEPRGALASGEDGLKHILQILAEAKNYLNPNGILIGEVGNSAEALETALPQIDFTWLEIERGGIGIFLLTYEQLKAIEL